MKREYPKAPEVRVFGDQYGRRELPQRQPVPQEDTLAVAVKRVFKPLKRDPLREAMARIVADRVGTRSIV